MNFSQFLESYPELTTLDQVYAWLQKVAHKFDLEVRKEEPLKLGKKQQDAHIRIILHKTTTWQERLKWLSKILLTNHLELLQGGEDNIQKTLIVYESKNTSRIGIAYHVTPTRNVEMIKKVGLLPGSKARQPENYSYNYHSYSKIFFTDNPNKITDILQKEKNNEPYSVLTVDLSGMDLKIDRVADGFYVKNKVIPPSLIIDTKEV